MEEPKFSCPELTNLERWLDSKLDKEDRKELEDKIDEIRQINFNLRSYARFLRGDSQIDNSIPDMGFRVNGSKSEIKRLLLKFVRSYKQANPAVASKSRKKEVVSKRRYLMYAMKHNTNLSLVKIGEVFGGKDHSTVLHNIRAHNNSIETKDQWYINNIKELEAKVKLITN